LYVPTEHYPNPLSYPTQARKKVAFLRRFKHDWATTTYLHRSFQNRRGYLKRDVDERVDQNGTKSSGTRHTNGDNDDDNDDVEVDDDLTQEPDENDFMDWSDDGEEEDKDEC